MTTVYVKIDDISSSETILDKRVYAGTSFTFNLPYNNNEVKFYLKFGEKNKLETFK